MTPEALAAMAVALITPYLVKAGEALAGEAGKAAWKGAQSVFDSIKKKFQGDQYASQTLEYFKENPQSPDRQTVFTSFLKEKIKEDPDFAERLAKEVEEVEKMGMGDVINQILSFNQSETGDVNVIGKGGEITKQGAEEQRIRKKRRAGLRSSTKD